ncbi:MAG: carboxypeptidase regulatory-like domain-containing protein [Planctomycetes bacterium]|nr:carboxypeptidase regulatory-like domain-containing protein [Planctomycetota bacterium]
MNAALKTILAILLIGGAAYGVMHFVSGAGDPPPLSTNPDDSGDAPDKPAPDAVTADGTGPKHGGNDSTGRTEVTAGGSDTTSLPQGLRGRCVTANGAPVPGVEVVLRKAIAGGFFGIIVQQRQGLGNPPIGSAVTGDDGVFEIGIPSPSSEALELWLMSDTTIDKRLEVAKIESQIWHDFGDQVVEPGAVLYGRVTDSKTGRSIEAATVSAKNPMNSGVAPPPSREDGSTATTDESGYYRIENLAPGTLLTSATAEGYATFNDHEARVNLEGHTEYNIELTAGLSISGIVVDEKGTPIPGAELSVVCLSTKTPLRVDLRAGRDGKFTAEGLVDAPFQINATAPGFMRATVQPVDAGTDDEQIVMEKQGGIRVTVRGSGGRAINRFSYSVMRWFPQPGGKGQFGPAYDVPGRTVTARDLDADHAFEISGINPGEYAVLIEAQGYAKTRSDRFKVGSNEPSDLVTVQMHTGGRLTGTVMGPDGKPMAGVTVSTMQNNYVEIPIFAGLQQMMPTEITKLSVQTNQNGQYRLDTLAAGTYQLKFSHPDAFDKFVRDVTVVDEQTADVPAMRLERGTRVFGTVMVDGKPTAGVKVSIGNAATAIAPGSQNGQAALFERFNAEAITNEHGEYQFARRVPPGEYTLRAGRTQGNPLMIMLDFTRSEQNITFGGQDEFEYSPNILTGPR